LLGILVGARKFCQQALGRHCYGRISLQSLIQIGVLDCLGMELLFDPFFKARLADLVDVAGTRAVGEAIHGVKDGFVFGKFGDREFAFEFFVEGDAFGGGGCAGGHRGLGAGLGVVCGAGMRDGGGESEEQSGTKNGGAGSVEPTVGVSDPLFVHCWSLGAHGALRDTNGFCCFVLV